MSGHLPPVSQQGNRPSGAGDDGEDVSAMTGSRRDGGGRVRVYLHAVTDKQVSFFSENKNNQPFQEVKNVTGADVELDENPSPVPGMKIVLIRGVPSQIEAAVRFISEKTGVKETISTQAQTYWVQWVEAAFPDLDSRAYFLPPVYVNRVPMTRQTVGGQDVLVLQSPPGQAGQSYQPATDVFHVSQDLILQPSTVYDSDIRDDAAMQRVFICLQRMFEQKKEAVVGINQLRFGQYLGEPCYFAATAQLPLSKSLPKALLRDRQGDFDILLIHRTYGLVICEVKSFGENVKNYELSHHEMLINIRKKLSLAVISLDKAEAMLSHLVSDIAPGLLITKTIGVPNLTAGQVQEALDDDPQLTRDLCRCLGTSDPTAITSLCLCCDQLSDPKTPCDVSSHVLRELGPWWQRRVAGAGPDPHMTPELYKILVARFCGPATRVSVPCTCPPRVSVKTLGQAVWCTGECYTAVITLFPEQLHLLHTQPPTLFVTGPPGTGKTVVLLLMAIQWLRCGHHVYVVSSWDGSRAACTMLYHLLLQEIVSKQHTAGVSPGQPHLLQYDFEFDEDVEKAVNDLSQMTEGNLLYTIVDEAIPGYGSKSSFHNFCDNLLTKVPRLHLWAANCYHEDAPDGWQVEYLTRPLRSPPAIVREVEQDEEINKLRRVHPYSERGVPDHTDGPPVRRLYHRGQGHSGDGPYDCVTCGRELASFLHSLRVISTENFRTTSTTFTPISGGARPPCLQWRDVLLLYWRVLSDSSNMVTGLREAGIPVRVMKDEDIEDVATARSDVVWVAEGDRVRGLERKVVVCLGMVEDVDARLQVISRSTSQLVIYETDES